ncbi:SDA1 domain-containing protein [Pseudovirgaria hyperparasitica]|uniref:Protein SDA1 n=1 Tax=Pseudovirgaria hyperparasitica TaxID=470096 RepID=A0A6A6W7D6_9PEZI|nr:SDA1 domain-containing protein [Pseudovirgaria hyperparasitica]KAF2756991.1 SDA1 domain-containing protein [Pseudovirgaria hyperparasitica]
MVKRKVGALEKIDADLSSLQYKARKDPSSYREDFYSQYQQYESIRGIFLRAPSSTDDSGIVKIRDLIDFISHVADCYPRETATFPDDLIQLLSQHHDQLQYELRDKVVSSLVLLRNKDVIDSSTLLNTLFPILVSTPSKTLRALLFQKILSDLRNSNQKSTNHRLNKTVQSVLQNIITSDRTSPQGIWAVKITRELWKRQVWTDAKAVEIMKEAALSENEKVITGGVSFFLGSDKEREEADESSDDDGVNVGKLRQKLNVNKKNKKNEKDLKRATMIMKKKEKRKGQPDILNFSALHLLHDPQGFAETLFQKHLQNKYSKLKLDQKLLVLQLVSRLVGLHKLTVIQLYSYFIKYLSPRQESVTSFLASLAQATHSLVPPDVLEPLVQKIANEFVSEAAATEVASAGLNAIREICARQPLAMSDTLLQDLVMYRKSKDKGVMMAAKGLLSLYREVGADMLKKRDRGKEATVKIISGERKEKRFGEVEGGGIEGLELLEAWKEEERQKRLEANGGVDDKEGDSEEEGWKDWDAESDTSESSEGWIDVHSDGEDIQVSDSDDEKPPAKKMKTIMATQEAIKENGVSTELSAKEKAQNLATTRILTPADLVKLQELRMQSGVSSLMRQKKIQQKREEKHADDPLTAADLEGLATLSAKRTKEEKIAMAKADREEKHLSKSARHKEKKISEGKSTTNKEKARAKNFFMTLGKAKGKQKRSLTDVRRTLKGHVDRQKRGGKRGNAGR